MNVTGVDESVLDRVSGDEYWAHEKKEGKGEEDFFKDSEAPQKKDVDPQRIEDQKRVNKVLIANIREVPDLEAYLGASFSLRGNERPHEMNF